MESNQKWICIYTSDSFFEVNLLRSLLESKGIAVSICAPPSTLLHDYLHDKNELIRVFIPAAQLEEGQRYTEKLIQYQNARNKC
ncbi:DUF2007 domain-containing protein [Anoxybacter fermentans]|nr:DUF2007 domain-containing protein [Anoxybacter fermentans]